MTEDEAKKIEKDTRGQANNRIWKEQRKYRLTASRFGEIIHATDRRDFVKFCCSLYSPPALNNASLVHGRTYEQTALENFSEMMNKKIISCGLFIHPQYPFLAATPDSLIEGENSIVEVKCPFSIKTQMISEKNLPYLTKESGTLKLKKTHRYFYQIMGQLILAQADKCYFVIFTLKDIHVEEIYADSEFFQSSMLPKLRDFYEKHYRPYVAEKEFFETVESDLPEAPEESPSVSGACRFPDAS